MDERPLLITAEDGLLLGRPAADCRGRRCGDRAQRRHPYACQVAAAPVVLLDAAMLRVAARAVLPRRPGIVVVGVGEPADEMWELCVRLGVERTVAIGGAASEQLLIDLLSDAVPGVPGRGQCLAVLGACGGAGASVFAAALALAAARTGTDSLLVDADPWGAGPMCSWASRRSPGLRWGDLAAGSGRLPADALQRALPSVGAGRGRVAVLTFGRVPRGGRRIAPTMDAVLASGRRAGRMTVVDLPRHPEPGCRSGAGAGRSGGAGDAGGRTRLLGRRPGPRQDLRQFGCRAGIVVRGPSPEVWARATLRTSCSCRCWRGCVRTRPSHGTWRSVSRWSPGRAGRCPGRPDGSSPRSTGRHDGRAQRGSIPCLRCGHRFPYRLDHGDRRGRHPTGSAAARRRGRGPEPDRTGQSTAGGVRRCC